MKKIKEKGNKEKKTTNIGLLITFMFALIVVVLGYIAMIKVEENVLGNYEKEAICVINQDIAACTKITEENLNQYVVVKEIDKSIIPEDSIMEIESLVGKSVREDLKPNTALTDSLLYSENELYASMENPKELGISMSDLAQGVSGTIRVGDYVDIYSLNKTVSTYNLSEAEMQMLAQDVAPLLTHVYVSGAFDASGVAIANNDNTTACQRLNIVVEEKDAIELYGKILDGYTYAIKEVSERD